MTNVTIQLDARRASQPDRPENGLLDERRNKARASTMPKGKVFAMRPESRTSHYCIGLLAVWAGLFPFRCGQDEPPPPPPTPIPQESNASGAQGGAAPRGAVEITVSAQSNPTGATVTGGGQPLGITPLTTRVPIPATPPGQPAPSFDFVFAKDGYQSATLQATPVNGQITITAALAPDPTAGSSVQTDSGKTNPGDEQSDEPIEIVGRGGGVIRDHRATTATATVDRSCVVDDLRVTLSGNHSYHQDLLVSLRSPGGQTYVLHRRRATNPFRRHRVPRARGQAAEGEWRLVIRDTVDQDTGRLRGFRMQVTCRPRT